MFPFSESIQLSNNETVSVDLVLSQIAPLLTAERLQKIDRVLEGRTFNLSLVLEDVYDRGNISAVLRSTEAMGIGWAHLIQITEKFKESQRTTAGADKWLEIRKWKSTAECVRELKRQGQQIVVTHLDETSVSIHDIDFTKPTAFVLGNEKTGVSKEMIQLADHRVILPMKGFVQSFNISVAGALGAWHMVQDRERRQGFHGDLTPRQKEILKAQYCMRTLDSADDALRERLAREKTKGV